MASLLWDFGRLDMRLRIWIEKIMLVLHIKRSEGSLASKIYEEQKSEHWPGLVQETDKICQCEIYGDIRAGFDNLDVNDNLVNFFNQILEMREDLEDKEREEERIRRLST